MKTPSDDSQARLLWGDKPPVVATDAPSHRPPLGGGLGSRGENFNSP